MLEDPWQDARDSDPVSRRRASVDAIVEAATRDADRRLRRGRRPADGDRRAGRRARSACRAIRPRRPTTARDKQRTRERLRDAGLPVPWFVPSRVDARSASRSLQTLAFPCVVKPVALSGSRGVMRADDAETFVAAFDRLRALVRRPRFAPSGTTRTSASGRRLHPGPRIRARRTAAPRARCRCWRSSTSPIRSTGRFSKRPST